MKRILLWLVVAVLGCKAPPAAPTELEELCSYIFTHATDGLDEADYEGANISDELLIEGLDNLKVWLDHDLASTLEGYSVESLSTEMVEEFDESGRGADFLLGAAVATESEFCSERVAEALVTDDQSVIWADNYDTFERSYISDPSCFPTRECTWLEGTSYGESTWAGIVDVKSLSNVQFRWVRSSYGWMMVQRSWLDTPAEVSWEGVDVFGQYFVAVVIPNGEQTIRMQATWIDTEYGVLPVSEDFAKQQIVVSMQNTGAQLETWMEEN
jgi:hypothetical protein